jgi:hypothetical protein
MARKLKILENEKNPLDDLKKDEITEKREKWEMHTVGPGLWRENWKSRIMRNTHFRTLYMARKTETGGKIRNVHCRMWNMATKLKIMENETHPLDDLKNDEINERREKWEMQTVGPGIWRENWKSQKMRITHFRTWNMARKTEKGGKFRNNHCRTWKMARTENHGKCKASTWRLEKWRNHWTTWKMRNAHFRTWNMARKLKITENEKYTL